PPVSDQYETPTNASSRGPQQRPRRIRSTSAAQLTDAVQERRGIHSTAHEAEPVFGRRQTASAIPGGSAIQRRLLRMACCSAVRRPKQAGIRQRCAHVLHPSIVPLGPLWQRTSRITDGKAAWTGSWTDRAVEDLRPRLVGRVCAPKCVAQRRKALLFG